MREHLLITSICLFFCSFALHAQTDTVIVKKVEVAIPPDDFEVVFPPTPIISYRIYQFEEGGSSYSLDPLSLRNAEMSTLTEALREAPGISTKRYSPGGLATPTFRGTGAGHTQLYWEGIPLNSPMLGQQDFSLSAGNLFDHISISYGGSSLLSGSGGIGGAIHLGNRPYSIAEKVTRFKIGGQYGSFQSGAANWDLNLRRKIFSSRTKLYYQSAKNNFPFVNTTEFGHPVQRLNDASTLTTGGIQEFGLSLGEHKLTARFWGVYANRDLPETMLVRNSIEYQNDRIFRSMLEWESPEFSERSGKLQVQAAYFNEKMLFHTWGVPGDYPSDFQKQLIQTNWIPSWRSLSKKWAVSSAGLRFSNDVANSSGFSSTQNQFRSTAHIEGRRIILKTGKVGLLLREEFVAPKMSLPLANLDVLVPLKIAKGPWTLKFNASHNNRFPTLNDLYWSPGGNPNLKPEQSLSAAGGLWRYSYKEYRLLHVGANLFVNSVKDWIIWLPGQGNVWSPENVNQVFVKGLEARVEAEKIVGKVKPNLLLNYTFSDSRDQYGYLLIYTPRHNAFARINLEWKNITLQYFQDYNSKRFTVADNSESISGFSTADLSMGYKLKVKASQFDLFAGMRNITNQQYQTVALRPMPGRSIFIRLNWMFENFQY